MLVGIYPMYEARHGLKSVSDGLFVVRGTGLTHAGARGIEADIQGKTHH
jgi:hypothetical protein